MSALATITVPGTDRTLMATLVDGAPRVSLRHCCDALGINYSTQADKLARKSWASVVPLRGTGADGKSYLMSMIDRRTLAMWLATIDEGRVKSEAREALVAFQAEAADALDAYFGTGVAVATTAGLSVFDMMRAQIDQLETAQRTADEAKAIATDTAARLDGIEARHDWFSALGYARLHDIANTSTQFLNRVGRQASLIARGHGIAPVKVQHHLYGEVNSYPSWIWEAAFDGITTT